MLIHPDDDDLIERLEKSGKYRVLRSLTVETGRTGVPYYGGETFIASVVDVETTGLDTSADAVVELAIRRFRFDNRGRILKLDDMHSWLEDPGRPLDPEISRVTGLTDAGLAGQSLDQDAAVRLLNSSHLIVAHNAEFDRKFIERRLPAASKRAWACSLREIDWAASGFEGKSLGWLVSQNGIFFNAHRASSDVDAVIALLSHQRPDGRTLLSELVERSSQPATRIEAVGAHFDTKDELRARGYRWDVAVKCWCRENPDSELEDEIAWLDRQIYGPGRRARSAGPRLVKMTSIERYA